MSQQPPNPPNGDNTQEVSGLVQRINQFGAAAERLFGRIYDGLSQRAVQETDDMARKRRRAELREMVNTGRQRNAALKATLQRRNAEIERLNAILETIDEGIIMQDNEGAIVVFNEAARALLGSKKNFWESELSTLFDAYSDVKKLESEIVPLGEPTSIQANHRILGVQIAAVANEGGERLGTMIVLRDVTRDAVADRLKDQFVTAISHELKTPMTVIKGMSEVLINQGDQPPQRRLLETLSRNVDILDRMVVELLDISEMGAGTFAVRDTKIDLQEMAWGVIRGLHPEMKRARLESAVWVRNGSGLIISGDEQRLRWALGHLLMNSIRYTERGGQVTVAMGMDEDHENYVVIDVIDTGVGISDKDLPHVFERFYRGEPRTSSGKLLDPRGLGQGLYVARTVAQAHGGYLKVRSAPGEGSIFTLVLPVKRPDKS